MKMNSWLPWLGVVAGPIAALLAVYIQDRRAKHSLKSSTSFQEREAGTHEFVALTEASARLREDLEKVFEEKFDSLRTQLTNRMNNLIEDYNEVVDHLEYVERSFPNPPGAPHRPTSIKKRTPYNASS